MDNRNLILELNPENQIIRIARGRQTVIAWLSKDNKTLYWKDAGMQAIYRTSVEAFLTSEGVQPLTTLLDGQVPDVVPDSAPEPPAMHKMQGDLTPKYLEWLLKWKPIAFQNLMGVITRDLKEGEKAPADPRTLWMRADVVRTDTRPDPECQGGQYISTRFKMEQQIIARRASHLTFTTQEIDRGDTALLQAEPYDDPHHPTKLHEMDKRGTAKIVSVRNAAASAGSNF